MAARFERGIRIPTGERRVFRRPLRRTLVVRAVLGGALLAAAVAALLLARGEDVRYAPLLPPGGASMVALDLSASVGQLGKIGETLRRVAREDQRAGLVVFSDAAYELYPPGTPGRELLSVARFFTPTRPGGDEFPLNPWEDAEFRAGTRISAGLEEARQALLRHGARGARGGSILLVSDLDAATDSQDVSDVLVDLNRDDIRMRIVPLDPLPENRALFEQLVGRSSLLAETDPDSPVATPAERRFGGALPWAFLFLAAGLVACLALNERLLARLEARA